MRDHCACGVHVEEFHFAVSRGNIWHRVICFSPHVKKKNTVSQVRTLRPSRHHSDPSSRAKRL